jgi:myxalamid-type polyketide synthase MxaE and MxaD
MADAVPSRADAVAVVGVACRLPGAASPAALWSLLTAGASAVTEIPPDRFDAAALYDPRLATPGRIASRRGGFLADIDRFDAAFFGMSPREAERLDPQQRLLLELTWEAFEDAGLGTDGLAGSATGVFVGMWLNDYEARLFADPARVDFHMTTGSGRYTASGRLSQVFGLRGPSLTLDTACSSSLVAVHLACQSLRSGETSLAVAAGVNVILQPHITIAYSQSRMMAPDGRCKFGDAGADGYVRSEGAGVVVLKPLARALADGDPIRAVVLGSAVNNDGGSGGSLGTPGRGGQEDLLRRAYRAAGIAPADVDYVEVHGTGTIAGDPVELNALASVLGEGRAADRPLVVGSIKTNVGHTEGAAGVAGMIKTILALEHGAIPASLHLHTPNPDLAWDRLPVVVQTRLGPWPSTGRPRRAGVSSFGIAGTNAHVVLEAAPPAAPAGEDAREGARLLPLSARSDDALSALAAAYRDVLRDGGRAAELDGLCYSAAVRRSHHRHRLAVVGADAAELADQLDRVARGERGTGAGVVGAVAPRVAFVFPGQGSQWVGMGRELLRREAVFRDALGRCDAALGRIVGWSVVAELAGVDAGSRLDRLEVVQPTLFAVQVALAALWRAWGVEPVAVVGHSMGEVAAAHVAGALTLDDAARVIGERSRLLQTVSGQGGMALVELSADAVRAALRGVEDRLSVAVCNSASSTVVAGDNAALDDLLAGLERRGVFCRRVKVDVASHSPQVDALLPALRDLLGGLRPGPAAIPFCSTVTGDVLDTTALDADYWIRNLRQPVLFATAVGRLLQHGVGALVEVSPHPVLLPAIRQDLADAVLTLSTLRRGEDERRAMLGSLAELYAAGQPVAWSRVVPGPRRCVSLPSYPWQRERFWYEPTSAVVGGHPVLGRRLELADATGVVVWDGAIDGERRAELFEHQLHGRPILAASGYLELLAAALDADGAGDHELIDVRFLRPLFLDAGRETGVQVHLQRGEHGARALRVHARAGEAWAAHVTALARPAGDRAAAPVRADGHAGAARTGDAFYAQCAAAGVAFGPASRRIERLSREADAAVATLGGAPPLTSRAAMLDTCVQVGLAAANGLDEGRGLELFVPASIGRLRFHAGAGAPARAYARRRAAGAGDGQVVLDAWLAADDGTLVLEADEVRLQRAGADVAGREPRFFELAWRPVAATTGPAASPRERGAWLVLSDGSGLGQAVAARLTSAGHAALVLPVGKRLADVLDATFVGVVDLRALDTLASSAGAVAAVSGALDAARALAASPASATRLWLVTRGAQAVDGASTEAAQAGVWGLGRVLAEESPEHWGGLVDLDPEAGVEACADAVVAELLAAAAERQVAVRRGRRHVPRLAPVLPATSPRRWRADATYLVTGGLGAVGLAVARWLVDGGARRLLLVGRTAMPPRAEWSELPPGPLATRAEAIRALERLGASVHLMAVDVGDAEALAGALAAFRREGWPPVRGVFHAAGVADDRLVTALDADAIAAVMRPKAAGAVALDALLGDDLDVFVLFSSIGALLGQPGQGAYAAANAFLDAFAHERRRRGRCATVVDWGVWRDLGLAATAGGRSLAGHLERQGFRPLDTGEALDALDAALGEDRVQLVVMPVHVPTLRESGAGAAPLLAELTAPEATGAATAAPTMSARQALAERPRAEWPAALEEVARATLAGILKLAAHRIDRERPLATLGLDSLMTLELRRRLEAALGIGLPATLVWNHPTVRDLGVYLAGRMAEAAGVDAGAGTPADRPAAGDVDRLTSDEVSAALEAELAHVDRLLAGGGGTGSVHAG